MNDAARARSLGWNYAPIDCHRPGRRPRGLKVRFADRDGRPVRIHVGVDGADPLTAGGLTDQIGHSANSVFLMLFRRENTLATDWRVRIGDRDLSRPGPTYVAPFLPAYSRDISVALFPFTQTQASFGDLRPSRDGLLVFRRDHEGSSYSMWSREGRRKALEVSAGGGVDAYLDVDNRHALRIDFARPLASPCATSAPATIPFSISIGGQQDLLTGSIDYRPGPERA